MRETKARGWIVQNSSSAKTRALRFNVFAFNVFVLNVFVLGVALAMTVGVARAADDDEDKGFSDKIIDSIKTTVRGGTNIDDGTIQYRERSPLVVPPKIDLPPPDTSSNQVKAPNWPKDPDEGRRRTAKKSKPGVVDSFASQFLPTKPGGVASAAPEEPPSPPAPPRPDNITAIDNPAYDRSGDLFTTQLGLSNFFGSKKTESATFNGEPTRDSLTQPPPGYQTPSPNFAYGANIKTEVPKPVEINSAGERVR